MAQLFPTDPDPGNPTSELRLREALREQLPNDWIVLHARRFIIPGHERAKAEEGEVDFFVIDRARGYIGLEVKGGGVRRDPNGWVSVDRHGAAHDIKDPGAQASRALRLIDKYLAGHPALRTRGQRIRFGWGVVLPDVTVKADMALGPELPRALVIDRADTEQLRDGVDRIFAVHGVSGPALEKATFTALLHALAPSFELLPTLGQRIEDECAALVRMTEEQMQLLDILAEFPRVAVRGPAGSGKTLVAFEKARRLAAAGKRVLFLCFTRPLADTLAGQADGFTVNNFHGLCGQMVETAGGTFDVPKDTAESRAFWAEGAVDALFAALDRAPEERFDAVIIDEGQDFLEYWWLAIERLFADPETSILYVFYDPNQDLYGGGPTEALGLRSVPLTYNCRNTARIAEYASALVDIEPTLKRGAPEGVAVEEIACRNEAEMVDAVRKTLHRLTIDEKVPTRSIVVLTPRATKHSALADQQTFGNVTLVDDANPGPNEIRFESLQRFKGLEEDVVVLCEVDPTQPSSSPHHLYVGTSRARHALVVIKYVRETAANE